MKVLIREEQGKDIEKVRTLLRMAFPTDVESRLVDVLRANGKAVISLVAIYDEKVLGHTLFSPITTAPPGEAWGIGLAPVAVLPRVQSQGIGSQLIRAGLQRCQSLGYDFCVVLGSPAYYQRFGFEEASIYSLDNEYGVKEEFLVIFFTDRRGKGTVQYGPEFALLSV